MTQQNVVLVEEASAYSKGIEEQAPLLLAQLALFDHLEVEIKSPSSQRVEQRWLRYKR